MLTVRKVTRELGEYPQIVALYESSFPEPERIEMDTLLGKSGQGTADFSAYYDNGHFVGFTFAGVSEDAVLLVYLAVEADLRSKGYGSMILKQIAEAHVPKGIMLNVEPPDQEAENYDQRLKRIRFYSDNGFRESGYQLIDHGDQYSILTTLTPFSEQAYRSAVNRLISGVYPYTVEKL